MNTCPCFSQHCQKVPSRMSQTVSHAPLKERADILFKALLLQLASPKETLPKGKQMEEGPIRVGFNPFSSVRFPKARQMVAEVWCRWTALPSCPYTSVTTQHSKGTNCTTQAPAGIISTSVINSWEYQLLIKLTGTAFKGFGNIFKARRESMAIICA